MLDASRNQLADVGDSLCACEHLVEVHLDYNQISTLRAFGAEGAFMNLQVASVHLAFSSHFNLLAGSNSIVQ